MATEMDVTLICAECDTEILSSDDEVTEISRTEFAWVCKNPECELPCYFELVNDGGW